MEGIAVQCPILIRGSDLGGAFQCANLFDQLRVHLIQRLKDALNQSIGLNRFNDFARVLIVGDLMSVLGGRHSLKHDLKVSTGGSCND